MMENHNKILDLLHLCLQLNPTETSQDKTGKKPTVFFWFSGHANTNIEINICKEGWFPDAYYETYRINAESGTGWNFFTADKYFDGRACTIDDALDHLRRLCKEWGVPDV